MTISTRHRTPVLTMLALLSSPLALAQESSSAQKASTIVRDLQQRYLAAQAAGDFQGAAMVFATDAEVLVTLPGNERRTECKGRDEIREKYIAQRRLERYEVEVDSARFVTPEMIVADGVLRKGTRQGYWTQLLRKEHDGSWKVGYFSRFLPPTVGPVAQQVSMPDQWELEIQDFEASDLKNPPKPGSILFTGSSSIRLWKNLAQDFPSSYVMNRGFGGARIGDVTHFVGRVVTPYRPRMILFYAGDNDLAEGRSPHQVLADFDSFVKRTRDDLPGIPIVFVSIKPSPSRFRLLERTREANILVKRYAAENDNIKFIDVFTLMMQDNKIRGELFSKDGLHMNELGYELWKEQFSHQLRELRD